MPNPSLSDAIKEAYATAKADIAVIETLELRHPAIASPLYLVKALTNMELGLETGETVVFEATGFRISLPTTGDGGSQELSIAVDNVERRPVDFIELALTMQYPVEVVYRPYLSNDLSAPQWDPPLTLYLTDVNVTAYEISGRATFTEIVNRPWPREYYTRTRFPGLGDQ